MSRMGGTGKRNNGWGDGPKGQKKTTHYIGPNDEDFDNSGWDEDEAQDKLRRDELRKEYEASTVDKRTPEERMIDERQNELAQLRGNGGTNKQRATEALKKMLQERQGGEIPDDVKQMIDNTKTASQNAHVVARQQQTKPDKAKIPDALRHGLNALRKAKGHSDNEGDSLPNQAVELPQIVPEQIPPAPPPPPNFMKEEILQSPTNDRSASKLPNEEIENLKTRVTQPTTTHTSVQGQLKANFAAKINEYGNDNIIQPTRKPSGSIREVTPVVGKNDFSDHIYENLRIVNTDGGETAGTIGKEKTGKRKGQAPIAPAKNIKKRQAPILQEQINKDRFDEDKYFKEQGKKLVALDYRIRELEKKGKFLNRIFEKKDVAKARIFELADRYKERRNIIRAMEEKNPKLADEVKHNATQEVRVIRQEKKAKKKLFRR